MASEHGTVDFAEVTRIQDRAIAEARPHIKPGGAVLVKAPTGAGKTRINSVNFANFIEDFKAEFGREPVILALQHRENLLNQNHDALGKWVPGDKISTSVSNNGNLDQSGTVNYATVQTVAARLAELKPIDLLSIDEAHHASDAAGADYTKVIERALELNPQVALLTTTATPDRPDKKNLNKRLASAAEVTIGYRELERAGQIILPNTKEVNIRMADGGSLNTIMKTKYRAEKNPSPAGLNKAIRAAKPADYNEQMLNAWEINFKDRIDQAGVHAGTIAFDSTIASARAFAAEAATRGHRVAVIDSDQSADANNQALRDYAAGKIDLLVSVKMIDEGIDVPHTRCILINRETTSSIEYHQMVGRSVRAGDDPALRQIRPTVLDGGASTMIHGAVERRAEVIDYLQRLAQEKTSPQRDDAAKWMPQIEGDGYSPWRLQKDPPPVMAITDGQSNIYAVATRRPDGEMLYTLSEAREVKGRAQVTIMKGEDGRPLSNISASRLQEIVAERLLAHREEVLRLEATQSFKTPGKSLADDRFQDDQVASAVMFAAAMRTGASR